MKLTELRNLVHFHFDGASWLVGWASAAVYYGDAPVWLPFLAFIACFTRRAQEQGK